ncbi:hypothetical protein D7322_07510 [Sphingobacterium puteale]|uniref:Uncharacterized protein n=1 Tax=Sphingobacterium puteale TaxID=2420510 RepID=A0A420W0C3_9SPHI|nr:hypothetical protein D7322_07510 [Sphingobacterium puteale]
MLRPSRKRFVVYRHITSWVGLIVFNVCGINSYAKLLFQASSYFLFLGICKSFYKRGVGLKRMELVTSIKGNCLFFDGQHVVGELTVGIQGRKKESSKAYSIGGLFLCDLKDYR